MKRNLALSFLLCLSSLAGLSHAGEPPFLEDRRPPRRIRYLEGEGLSLDAGNTEILVSTEAYGSTRFAASELRRFLSGVLGGELPIVSQATPGRNSLIVGINESSRAAGIDDRSLCRDAYIIRTIGSRIHILGLDDRRIDTAQVVSRRDGGGTSGLRSHQRGTLFGVYEFLERFGGVRFYHADDLFTIVPRKDVVRVPRVDIYDRPDNEVRFYSIFSGLADDDVPGSYWDPLSRFSPSKALDYCRFRGDTRMIPDCHGLARLFYLERFAKTHPEYFALHANGARYCDPAFMHTGQLCFSSPIMDVIYEDAKAILGGNPEEIKARDPRFYNKWGFFTQLTGHAPGRIFNFMPQDAYYHCRCPKCLPHMKDEQSIADFVWGKAAELAERLKAAGVDGHVSAMAYPPCHLPPTKVRLPDNLIVMVAQNGPWDPPEVHRRNVALVDRWNKVSNGGCKVWMWNYVCKVPSRNLVLPGVPCSTPWAVGGYYRDMAGRINGAFLESNSSATVDTYMMQALDYYVFGKVNWDNQADYQAILDEYFRLCYGGGAPEMKRIFRDIERTWLTRIGGRTILDNLGPRSIPPSENELWNDIYDAERIVEMEQAFARAERLAKGDALAGKRIRYMRKHQFENLARERENYLRRTESIGGFREELSPGHPAVLHLQPLKHADRPFPGTRVTVRDLGRELEFAFDCDEPQMDRMIAAERAADDPGIWQDCEVEVMLNPSGDRVNYYHFMLNACGSFYDARMTRTGARSQGDRTWDSGAVHSTSRDAKSWRAVIRLAKAACEGWNPEGFVVNFNRSRAIRDGDQELYSWSPFLDQGFHELERFGRLVPEDPWKGNIVDTGSFRSRYWNRWGGWQDELQKPGQFRGHDPLNFVFGDKSLRISYTGTEGGKDCPRVGQTLYDVKPGTHYELSFYLKLENVRMLAKGGGAGLQIWNTKKNFWFPVTYQAGDMPWTQFKFDFTSLPETDPRTTVLNCNLRQATGTAWFDGISLIEIK